MSLARILRIIYSYVGLIGPQLMSDYVGVPDAPIDYKQAAPERPADWSSEVSGYYYINEGTGSNANTYGTPANPRQSLPSPIPAGSYIEVDGTYSQSGGGVIRVDSNGTSDTFIAGTQGPVWVTKANGGSANFTGDKMLITGTNLFIDGITTQGGSFVQVGSPTEGYPASSVVIRNCEVIGILSMVNIAGMGVGAHQNSPCTDIIFYNNIVRDMGDVNSAGDDDAGCITASGYSSNVWIIENTGYNASGAGLQINPQPPYTACHHVYAAGNEFYSVRQSGMWVKHGTAVVFSGNYVHDIITTTWSPAKGMGAQYEPNGLWMFNNIIHDVEYGIRIPSTYDIGFDLKVYAVGNIIYDVHTLSSVGGSSWDSSGIHCQGAEQRYIYNNLIFNTPGGINISSTFGTTDIKNNIIVGVDNSHSSGQGHHIWAEYFTSGPALDISNNYFETGEMSVQLTSTDYVSASSLNAQTTGSNLEGVSGVNAGTIADIVTNGLYTAAFEDAGEDVLTALSAIYASDVLAGYPIDKDILGSARITGATLDIGPFEKLV